MIVFEPLGSVWVPLRGMSVLFWHGNNWTLIFFSSIPVEKVLVEKLVLFFLSRQSELFLLLKLMLSWACTDRKKLELRKGSIPRKHEQISKIIN